MANGLDDNYGAKATVIPFANIGQTDRSFKLANIKPINGSNITPEAMINAVYFQLLDNGGYTIADSDRFWDGSKWTTVSGSDMSDETYAPGAGLWMYNVSYNPTTWDCGIVSLQSSGEVITENVIANLDDNYGAVFIGNPFPAALKLSDIIPLVSEGTIPANTIYFQKLDNGGYTVNDSDRFWDGSKWTTVSGSDMSDETLAPGEGVWMYNVNYDPTTWECVPATVRFVAPEI